MVLVTIAALFISMYRSQEKASHGSTGVLATETVLNTNLHRIFTGGHPTLTKTAFFSTDAPPSPSIEGSLNLGATEYLYKMDYSTVSSPAGVPVGTGLSGNRLKLVTVTCWWWAADAVQARAGYGRQSYTVQRLVNENDAL